MFSIGKTFSWYSFWPLSVVLVMVLMGLWLWRTWKKFVGPRSDIERSYSNCTSPCHHHHSNTCVSDVMEPPSYSEAVVLGDQPPPSYEEALAHRQSRKQPMTLVIVVHHKWLQHQLLLVIIHKLPSMQTMESKLSHT